MSSAAESNIVHKLMGLDSEEKQAQHRTKENDNGLSMAEDSETGVSVIEQMFNRFPGGRTVHLTMKKV